MLFDKKKIILILVVLSLHFVTKLEAQPLSILFVVEYFPAPSQVFILNLITGLIDNGHNVSIFAFRKNNSKIQHSNVEKYSLLDRVIYEKFPVQLPDYDIVFCQSGTLGKQIFEIEALTEWLSNRKVVVSLRGNDITKNLVRENPEIYKDLFEKGDLFLPVCDYFKNLLVTFGCPSEKIVVHHSAINCSQFFFKKREKAEQEPIRLVSVCRLVEKKGMEYAIKAIASIVKRRKNIHFTIVGRGRLKTHLEELIQRLNITDKVTLFGWATHDQIVQILDQSHIFLLPSITSENGDEEGIANALKEAMAMGLISIATWHAGTPELIDDGVSGFLVPQKNSKKLAEKVKYVIDHPELWQDIGLAARKKIEEEFETKQSISKLEELFYALINYEE